MRELVIENPTRITQLGGYGLNARVETPGGVYTAVWDKSLGYGWFWLHEGDKFEGPMWPCRNEVLVASVEKSALEDRPDGQKTFEIEVLTPEKARAFLDLFGIPKDGWRAFNRSLSDG